MTLLYPVTIKNTLHYIMSAILGYALMISFKKYHKWVGCVYGPCMADYGALGFGFCLNISHFIQHTNTDLVNVNVFRVCPAPNHN